MTNVVSSFFKDESGAAAAEYVLILAVLGAGIAAGASYFGSKISASLTTIGNSLSNQANSF